MGDFRIRYGWALGPEGTFAAMSDRTLITPGDTSPDVSLGSIFYTNNTSATTITYWDVTGPGGASIASANHEGKVIYVYFNDANTSITASSVVLLKGGSGVIPAGTWSKFVLRNSAWYEVSRETPAATGDVQTFTLGGTSNTLNVTGLKVAIITGTATPTLITALSGGEIGQTVYLAQVNTNGIAIQLSQGNNIFFPGSTTVVLNTSGAYPMTRISNTVWVGGPSIVP